jgi:hypothetical protein
LLRLFDQTISLIKDAHKLGYVNKAYYLSLQPLIHITRTDGLNAQEV